MVSRPRISADVALLLFGLVVGTVFVFLLVSLDHRGDLINPEVQRTGVATISNCEPAGPYQRCSATVTWQDGSTSVETVRSTTPISGPVTVTAHESWQPSRTGSSQRAVVVAEGFPLNGNGKLMVVGLTVAMIVVLAVARAVFRRLLPSSPTRSGRSRR